MAELTAKRRWMVRAVFLGCIAVDCLGCILGYSSDRGVCCAMVNNTILAYLPVEMSLHLSAGRKPIVFWALFALWAIFFPNAPYVLTDYFHLARVDVAYRCDAAALDRAVLEAPDVAGAHPADADDADPYFAELLHEFSPWVT